MAEKRNNYAFIDGQNLHLGIQSLGWKLDFARFRQYLAEKYSVTTAYYFIGYVPGNQPLYSELQKAGYVLVFKPTIPDGDGNVKGNIDADLVLQAMIDFPNYDKAIIVTSDGDFYSLVKHLYQNDKLRFIMSPYVKTCSSLLKREAKEKIVFMSNLKRKLGKK
ncbi:MAG: NYN domain-containing protein [Candidatus Wildermuthbacteria bacterium]|nr:NYN domain-containing protein [Candidatus Wildermuthbacteria bacterium]